MPFSATDSCTEKEWTWIFKNLLKPAVENADLNYVCHRSAATRGNIVRAIMESLRDAYVVVADLTDQKPNVFYELGVRHALKNRTILIAQDQRFMPSDLLPYAYHIYNWRTGEGRQELATRLRELLADVDQSPERPDNPVSDFLKGRRGIRPPAALVEPLEERWREYRGPREPSVEAPSSIRGKAPAAEALAGPQSEGVDTVDLGRTLAKNRDGPNVRAIVVETRRYLSREWPRLIDQLNEEAPPGAQVATDQIYEHCLPYIQRFSPDAERVEQFGLALVAEEYGDGLAEMLRILEGWISLSEEYRPGGSLRAVRGAPGLLALRCLANWGAKAADDMGLDILGLLLTHPLTTTESGGQAATLAVVDRRDFFWPEGLFGRADLAVRYLQEESWSNEGLQRMFPLRQDHLGGLSRFLFTAALIYDARHPEEYMPLYPGFKLIRESSDAVRAFVSRVRADPKLVGALAQMAGEDVPTFRANWPERRRRLNEAPLGGRHDLFLDWDRIQEDI
jgi:hypothetical protein